MEVPAELLEDMPDEKERAARIGKWLVMEELRLPFEHDTLLRIARDQIKERSFTSGVRKIFSSRYGDTNGLSKGDIELAAVYLGVFDDIWPQAQNKQR